MNLKLRRQTGYPVDKAERQKFKDLYRDGYDEIHKDYEDKKINMDQYAERAQGLYDQLQTQFNMYEEVKAPENLYDLYRLIETYEAPILVVINAETGTVEGIIMDEGL